MMNQDPTDDITFGRFIPSNIRKYILKECIESGDPSNFLLALSEAVDYIRDSIRQIRYETDYWDMVAHDLGMDIGEE
jgi:hypothetical protein